MRLEKNDTRFSKVALLSSISSFIVNVAFILVGLWLVSCAPLSVSGLITEQLLILGQGDKNPW
jgi:hypothetical protein